MNRPQAVAISKEVATLLQNHTVKAIKLIEQTDNATVSTQVIIQAYFDKNTTQEIKNLTQKRGLNVTFQNDQAVIYKPKEQTTPQT